MNKFIYPIDTLIIKLDVIQTNLLKAFKGLPPSFEAEKNEAESLLHHLMTSWKDIANELLNIVKNSILKPTGC